MQQIVNGSCGRRRDRNRRIAQHPIEGGSTSGGEPVDTLCHVPRLSVLCITCDPGPQVQAVLAPLRALASEIVVCADERVSDADVSAYAAVADRVVRYPFARPVERPLAWAHALCQGDWILRIDGDEVPTPELVQAISVAIERVDRTQYWIRRRWLYPTVDSWIDARPWCADFQLRLVRNDPALLSFEGAMHTTARATWSAGFIEAPMYHLDLLVKDESVRRAKSDDYEGLRPGLRAPGGGPMEIYYLPERWLDRAPAPTPDEHRELLRAATSGELACPPVTLQAGAVESATRDEIDAYWDTGGLEADDYRAELELVDPDTALWPGEADELTVRVTNRGGRWWPGGDATPAIRLGYRWRSSDGAVVRDDGGRGLFPSRVAPGEQVLVRLPVRVPADAGDALILELDVVHELVRWFEQPVRIPVRLRSPWSG